MQTVTAVLLQSVRKPTNYVIVQFWIMFRDIIPYYIMGYFMFERPVYTNRDRDSNGMATVPNGISVSM